MTTDTLTITIESTGAFFAGALTDLHAVVDGDDIDDAYVLSLPDEAALQRVLSAKNIELLGAIATEEPDSVRGLARLVDRDVKNVSNALSQLADLGLLAFERDGRAKRPVVWYDGVEIDIRLTPPEDDSGTVPS